MNRLFPLSVSIHSTRTVSRVSTPLATARHHLRAVPPELNQPTVLATAALLDGPDGPLLRHLSAGMMSGHDWLVITVLVKYF